MFLEVTLVSNGTKLNINSDMIQAIFKRGAHDTRIYFDAPFGDVDNATRLDVQEPYEDVKALLLADTTYQEATLSYSSEKFIINVAMIQAVVARGGGSRVYFDAPFVSDESMILDVHESYADMVALCVAGSTCPVPTP